MTYYCSYVEHRFGGWGGEGFEGYFFETSGEAGGDFFPCALDGGAGFALVKGGVLELGGFHGLYNLAQVNVLCWAG